MRIDDRGRSFCWVMLHGGMLAWSFSLVLPSKPITLLLCILEYTQFLCRITPVLLAESILTGKTAFQWLAKPPSQEHYELLLVEELLLKKPLPLYDLRFLVGSRVGFQDRAAGSHMLWVDSKEDGNRRYYESQRGIIRHKSKMSIVTSRSLILLDSGLFLQFHNAQIQISICPSSDRHNWAGQMIIIIHEEIRNHIYTYTSIGCLL